MGWFDPPPLVQKPRPPETPVIARNGRYYLLMMTGVATWVAVAHIPWFVLLGVRYVYLWWRGSSPVFWAPGASWVEASLILGVSWYAFRLNRRLYLALQHGKMAGQGKE
jgi:hypothetical protein